MSDLIASDLDFDGAKVVDDLNRLLRLRTTPIGMKLFSTAEENGSRYSAFAAQKTSTQPIRLWAKLLVTAGQLASPPTILLALNAVPSSACTRETKSGCLATV